MTTRGLSVTILNDRSLRLSCPDPECVVGPPGSRASSIPPELGLGGLGGGGGVGEEKKWETVAGKLW